MRLSIWANRSLNKLILELYMLLAIDQSTDKSDGTVNILQVGRKRTAGTKDSPLRRSFQTGSGIHRDFCSQSTVGIVLRGQSGRGLKLITHLRLTPTLRMIEIYLQSSMCLTGVYSDKFTFDCRSNHEI